MINIHNIDMCRKNYVLECPYYPKTYFGHPRYSFSLSENISNSMKKIRLFLYGIILILCCSHFSYAQSPNIKHCGGIDVKADERPDPVGTSTEVTVGFRLIDVTGIEDPSQTIALHFMVTQEWTDQRMAEFEGCQYSLNEVWTPQIDVINFGRLFTRHQKPIEVLGNGRLRHAQRYSGALVFVYDAHRFPFDTQDIVITLLSEEYDQESIVITIDEAVTGRNPVAFNIPDWTISDVNAQIVTKHFEIDNRDHSAFEFLIPAKRRSGFFIWKVIVPLMLIVFMSWTVFWINPSQVGPQISMSATAMLTLIAFQFAMGDILPHLSYFTVMDRFVTGSTILVFLALIESITTNYLVTINRENLALKMDRYCSWVFPVIFFILVLIVLVY
jgi:hypothetical protein